jgi:hypothetical protein
MIAYLWYLLIRHEDIAGQSSGCRSSRIIYLELLLNKTMNITYNIITVILRHM